jgi:acyl-coenzyme A synthetase/AMP-(fatty) acid ligase
VIFSLDEASRSGDAALVDGSSRTTWTYIRLAEEVERRRRLIEDGQKRLVFHFCENALEHVGWYFALLEAGHAQALLNQALDLTLRAALIDRFRPDYVILREQPSDEYVPCSLPGLWRLPNSIDDNLHPDLALLLPTSGTTGTAKFVRLSRRNLEANALSIRDALMITGDHRPIAHLPMHYSYGLSIINSHLLAGSTVVITNESVVTSAFWDVVRREQVTSFSGVPYTYEALKRLDLRRLDAPSIQDMTQAGGKLDTNSVRHFYEVMAERGGRFWVMYGQTEATARIAILPAADLPKKLGSAGKAIPGGRLEIALDGSEDRAEAGEGELVYTGPNVMMGYAEQRWHLCRGDDLDGRLFTRDRVRLDEHGYVYILGRAGRDVKVFGLRINLDEVEAMVKVIGPAAAIGSEDRLIFFCEFGNEAEFAEIRRNLSKRLRLHLDVFHFRRVDKLPVTANGKIDYSELARR